MWRIVHEKHQLTGKNFWVIEKKTGWIQKKWSRDYPTGDPKIYSPIKSLTKHGAIAKLEILKSGNVIIKTTEVI